MSKRNTSQRASQRLLAQGHQPCLAGTRPVPSRSLHPRTHPEGAEPERRLCRICGSGYKRLQASRPGGQGLELNSRGEKSRTTKSSSDARDLLLQARSGFSKGRAAQPMRPRHSTPLHSFLQVSPNSSWEAPQSTGGVPETPRALASHPHLRLSDSPYRVLPARYRSRVHGKSEANHEKMPSRGASLHTPALSLKQKRREEGGGRGGGRKVSKEDGALRRSWRGGSG